MKLISEAIQEAIQSTEWSDQVWAKKLHITYQTVWGWRKKKQTPHRRNIEKIAEVLENIVVFNDDESMCVFRKPNDELPQNVRSLFQMMRWDHWTTNSGKQMRFDRSSGMMQEYNHQLNQWVTLGENTD